MLLLDEKGHALRDLNQRLRRKESELGNLGLTAKKLENDKIIYKLPPRKTTNPNSARPNTLEHPYCLRRDSKVFNSIMNYLISDDGRHNLLNDFLNSEYTNSLIEHQSFNNMHEYIKKYLEREHIKLIASKTLLTQSATINVYKNLADDIQKSTIGNLCLGEILLAFEEGFMPKLAEQIEILSDFNSLEAVRLYRETLHRGILKAFESLTENSVITNGLRDFMVWDNYLSPLSSYPVNGTSQLLFAQPFQRIYEDAYLLDGEMVGVLSARALTIYENFSDILFELFNVDRPTIEDRKLMTKEMIFHWNVACTRFDRVCSCLADLFERGEGSGNFHVESDGLTLKIIDLESKKQLLDEEIAKNVLKDGAMPMIFDKPKPALMKDPCKYLRPSITFKMFKGKYDYIPFEDILLELESKLAPRDKVSI